MRSGELGPSTGSFATGAVVGWAGEASMPTLDFGVQQTQVSVRVKVRGPGGETTTHEVPSGPFETAEPRPPPSPRS
jgi:hypothetical protein